MAASDPAPPDTRLRKNAVGVIAIMFFVLSAQAPLTGIAGGTPLSMGLGNGAGAPGAYLGIGIMIIIFAVGFITMSRYVTDAGAFYAYIGRGLGRPLGAASAMTALWCYGAIQAAMYGLYGVVVSGLLSQYGHVTVPWWVCAVITMLVVFGVGVAGIDMGARVLAVLVGFEMSILLAFAFGVLFTGGGPHGGSISVPASFSPSAVLSGASGVAIVIAIASMFGFESTAIYSEEAKDPRRTVPRATYLSVVFIGLFFAFVTWMLVSYYGASHVTSAAGAALKSGNTTAFAFNAITGMLGSWAGTAANFLLASSLLAGILAFHNAINRYVYSLGHHGTLPVGVSHVNRRGAPWVAGVIQTVMALALVLPFAISGSNPVLTLFAWLSGVSVLALMVLYFLTAVSVVTFFRRTRADTRPWQTLIAPALAGLMILGVTCLIIANFTTLIGGNTTTAAWLIVTVPVAFIIGLILNAATKSHAHRWRPGEDLQAAPAGTAAATPPTIKNGADGLAQEGRLGHDKGVRRPHRRRRFRRPGRGSRTQHEGTVDRGARGP
jgi:amino acid transporter